MKKNQFTKGKPKNLKQLLLHNSQNSLSLIDVPKDGNCLFWATMLAYLEPVKNNIQEYQKRYNNLFGNHQNYEKISNFDDIDKNKNLVSLFRNNVVEYMQQNRNNFKNFKDNNSFDNYLKNLKKDGSWGNELEIKAISDLLKTKIHVNKYESDKLDKLIISKTYPETSDNNYENEIKIAHVNDNHYQYFIKNNYQCNIIQNQNLENNQPITIINTIPNNNNNHKYYGNQKQLNYSDYNSDFYLQNYLSTFSIKQNQDIYNNIDNQKEKIKHLEDKYYDAQKKIKHLEDKYYDAQKKIKHLEDDNFELKNVKRKRVEWKQEFEYLKIKKYSNEDFIKRLKKENENLKHEYYKEQRTNKNYVKDNIKYINENNTLKKINEEIIDERKKLENKNIVFEKIKNVLAKLVLKKNIEIIFINSKNFELISENKCLKESKKEINNKLIATKNSKDNYINELDEAYDNNDLLETKIKQMNENLFSSPKYTKILNDLEDNEFDVTRYINKPKFEILENIQIKPTHINSLENSISPNNSIFNLLPSDILENSISPNNSIFNLLPSDILENSISPNNSIFNLLPSDILENSISPNNSIFNLLPSDILENSISPNNSIFNLLPSDILENSISPNNSIFNLLPSDILENSISPINIKDFETNSSKSPQI